MCNICMFAAMRHLTFLFFFGTTVIIDAAEHQCGQTPIPPKLHNPVRSKVTRIVGGVETIPYSWPWQVLFEIKLEEDGKIHTCGGSIISNYWILTAAHCTVRFTADNVHAWTGVYYRNHEAPAVPLNFKNVIIHPKFESTEVTNDISLIELATPIEFNDHTQPICLPSADKGVDVPTNTAWATGWGNLEFKGASSDTLRQVELPFVENPACESSWKEVSGYKLNETLQLCAGKAGEDTCQGDSGGPLVVKSSTGAWFQHGITSYGNVCADGVPGVYTRVSGYCDWISSTTNGTVGCQ